MALGICFALPLHIAGGIHHDRLRRVHDAVVRFVIVAFAIFLMVRWIDHLFAATKSAPADPTATETLLTEIRDALKARPVA